MDQELITRLEVSGGSAFMAWGHRVQMIKACEEMGELTMQLCKWLNGSPTTIENLIDEVADVFVVAFQMRLFCGMGDVDRRITYKLNRLAPAIAQEMQKDKSI